MQKANLKLYPHFKNIFQQTHKYDEVLNLSITREANEVAAVGSKTTTTTINTFF